MDSEVAPEDWPSARVMERLIRERLGERLPIIDDPPMPERTPEERARRDEMLREWWAKNRDRAKG